MKYISIDALKPNSQSITKTIEEVIKINPKNLPKTLVLEDLEKLKEALFYKKEETSKNMNTKSPKEIIKEFEQFEKQFNSMQISEIGPIKAILDEHKEINELKEAYRIINLLSEIKKGNVEIMDGFLYNPEDWQFFCVFLKNVLNESRDEKHNHLLKTYRRRIEERMLKIFEESLIGKDKDLMRKSYEALKELDKQDSIIKCYMFSLPIFQEIKKEKNEKDTIDIDSYNDTDNSFVRTVQTIENIYQDELTEVSSIFIDYKNVLDLINKRIFEDILAGQLEYLLDKNDATRFLLNFKMSFDHVKALTNLIRSFYPDFDDSKMIDDLYDPYFPTILFREKESLDFLFDILVKKIKPKTHFLIQGEALFQHEFKPLKILSKLILIMDFVLERAQVFDYDKEDLWSICNHFVKKTKEFVDVVFSNFSSKERLDLIKILSDIYKILEKCYDSTIDIKEIEKNIGNKIQAVFENRVEEAQIRIRMIVKSINIKEFIFGNSDGMKKLVDFLKSEQAIVERTIKGSNGNNYFTIILNYTYHKTKTQYLSFIYDRDKAEVFRNDMGLILGFVKGLNNMQILDDYEYLYEIAELLLVRKEDVGIFIKGMFHKIPESEYKKILKCRDDYQLIKKNIKLK